MTSITVAFVDLDDLRPFDRNARVHDDRQIGEIEASIRSFGWTNPILADMSEDGVVIAGHGRLLAARRIYASGAAIRLPDGREIPHRTVPVIDCAGWSDDRRRAYTLADNRIAENATWDDDLLRIELRFLKDEGIDLGIAGFDEKTLAKLLDEADGEGEERPSLSDRFGLPPFSVLNAREGWWQDRKRAWLDLGIQSELGRGENMLGHPDTTGNIDFYARKRALEAETGLAFSTSEARAELKRRGEIADFSAKPRRPDARAIKDHDWQREKLGKVQAGGRANG
jgi:ParB-like chromosome segregation protein Spo0J